MGVVTHPDVLTGADGSQPESHEKTTKVSAYELEMEDVLKRM